MDDGDLVPDAFATEGLWRPSRFFDDPTNYESSLFGPLELDVPSIKFEHPYAPKEHLEREIRLLNLDSFEFGQLPALPTPDESVTSAESVTLDVEEDVWQIALEQGPVNQDVEFFTWESFENRSYVQHRTPYITESGPQAFDAALVKDDATIPSGKVLKSNVFLDSMFNLGLGRSSILFNFDSRRKSFAPAVSDGRPSGLTPASARSLIDQFTLTGNTYLYLRSFAERTFSLAASFPAKVALATCVASILSTLEDHLGTQRSRIGSLLQLQELYAKPQQIITHVARMVDAVKHAKTNEQLSSILHQRVLEVEEGDAHLRLLSSEILVRTASPSLELLSEWVGVRKEEPSLPTGQRYSFIALEDKSDDQESPEYSYNPAAMPRFITPEDAEAVFETGNSLRFLKSHHPGHPLVSLEKFHLEAPQLEWKFDWADIETISTKAKAYEESLRRAILDFSNEKTDQRDYSKDSTPDHHPCEGAELKEDIEAYFERTTKILDGPPDSNLLKLPDDLRALVEHILLEQHPNEVSRPLSVPPLSMTSTLSFRPLLSAQAKLVNATTIRLFFRSHQLRLHISLQRQYHLFGDGVFSSRLATALFDPERETAERRKGTMRSGVRMGLQVGARSSWPPASSELRLALSGVLSETFHSSALYLSTLNKAFSAEAQRRSGEELPGQLNFAVRHLTEPEQEKIMDPDSLYALDFLRLQYVPPSPLNLVITRGSLEKYDYIFKFLLRLLRMVFVVAHLPREYTNVDSRKFKLEAHHFITALSTHIFQTGIAEPWDALETSINSIETRLAQEDAAGEIGTRVTEGLAALKSAHDKCLDGIMFALLLRRRQKKIMSLLEEIFEHILLFAKMQKTSSDVEIGGDAKTRVDGRRRKDVTELYIKLKGKIKVFISVCRGLTGKRGYGKGRGTSEENTMERLLVLLEMNNYYTT
ncbi:Spc98 family-domain-containing protein [Lophiotrema nucula]|uniref:Spindle pole body component n=1 Tax=Lophiotrema nucula TaxID=690887 RepID=A0A6A5ZU27_9PLEO|nr:Spc98 family-domain-containing protein [Lophiotrema nucula]